jgi:hypothetical protein
VLDRPLVVVPRLIERATTLVAFPSLSTAKTTPQVGWREYLLAILLVDMANSNTPFVLTGLLTLALSVPIGCNEEPFEGGDEVSADTGEDPTDEVCKSSCQECEELMKDPYACMAFTEDEEPLTTFECIVCDGDGPGSAAITCETQANLQSISYATMDAQVIACDASMAAANCTGWSPNRQVHPKRANEWDVERDLIKALVADPSQVVGCDDARVKRFGGFYRVTSVDSDDLLGRLGLMNDDVIQSINGYSMSGPSAVALAFFNLWPDTRVFTVTVLRSGVGTLTLTYNLV